MNQKKLGGTEEAGRVSPQPDADEAITRNLRAIYDRVVSEPLPQQFVDLLSRLEKAEKRDG